MSQAARLVAVRAKIAALMGGGPSGHAVLALGDPRIDGVFPAAGLPLGCWHEVAGEGLEAETAAAPAGFAAALARPLAARGAVVWILRRDDLYAPGLAGLGFPADRLVQVRARDEAQVLAALEDALGSAGVAAAVGEAGTVDLTAGRRLQLACERHGATGFVVRRRAFGAPAPSRTGAIARPASAGSAAATRWTVSAVPSGGEGAPGAALDRGAALGPRRWRAELTRCRGGRTGEWILETSDGAYPLRVVAEVGDRQLEAAQSWRRAG